uniref:Uncharacterized protein n=1 Tax=viral metagenome TaxID=1070528 RepID=A0A6C0LN88_9ZZZZ
MSFFSSSTQNLEYTPQLALAIRNYKKYDDAAKELFSTLKSDSNITIIDDTAAEKLIDDICYYVFMKVNTGNNMYIIHNPNKQLYKIYGYSNTELNDVNNLIPQLIKIELLKPYKPMLNFVKANIPSSGGKKTKSKKNKSKKNKSKKNKTRRNHK